MENKTLKLFNKLLGTDLKYKDVVIISELISKYNISDSDVYDYTNDTHINFFEFIDVGIEEFMNLIQHTKGWYNTYDADYISEFIIIHNTNIDINDDLYNHDYSEELIKLVSTVEELLRANSPAYIVDNISGMRQYVDPAEITECKLVDKQKKTYNMLLCLR